MNIQEEIHREIHYIIDYPDINDCDPTVDRILKYLHSKGVVIWLDPKRERKCKKCNDTGYSINFMHEPEICDKCNADGHQKFNDTSYLYLPLIKEGD